LVSDKPLGLDGGSLLHYSMLHGIVRSVAQRKTLIETHLILSVGPPYY
jgi:hypothetical protein